MTMTTSRAAVLGALLAASAPAALAKPTIVVDEAIPFSADDLATAVSIRADSDAEIVVSRRGDLLVITVGDQARSLQVDPAIDAHDLARVVALVVLALDAQPRAPSAPATPAPLPPNAPPPPPPPTPPTPPSETPPVVPVLGASVLFGSSGPLPAPKNWTLRFQLGYGRTEWTDSRPIMATVSRRLGPSAHLVFGIGLDKTSVWSIDASADREEVTSIPTRAGVELRHRWLAIEAGLAMTRWTDACTGTTYATGGYAAARAYLVPIGSIQNRVYAEGGIRHVTSSVCMDWDGNAYENRDTTIQASIGLELPL